MNLDALIDLPKARVFIKDSEEAKFHPLGDKEICPSKVARVVRETWQWCEAFVVEYGLCPWARNSVQTKGAISIFVVNSVSDFTRNAVEEVSRIFLNDLERLSLDPNAAIAFLISL